MNYLIEHRYCLCSHSTLVIIPAQCTIILAKWCTDHMKVEQLQTVLSKEYNENNAKKTAMLCVIWQELKKLNSSVYLPTHQSWLFQRASLFTDLWFLWLKWSEPLWLNNIVGRFSATLFALRGDQNEPKCSQTNYCWKKIKQETHTHQWSRSKSWLCKVLYCLPHCLTNLWFFIANFCEMK